MAHVFRGGWWIKQRPYVASTWRVWLDRDPSKAIKWQHLLPEMLTVLYWTWMQGDLLFLLLPVLLRAFVLGSVALHGFAHALGTGSHLSRRLGAYRESLPLHCILPFGPVILPGLMQLDRLPRMPVRDLSAKRLRVAALAGPGANLLLMLMLLPFLPSGSDMEQTGAHLLLCLVVINLWILLTSWSDYVAALSGRGDHFFCGNFGILAKRQRNDRGFIPRRFKKLAKQLGESTDIRGQQAGGVAVLAEGGGFLGCKIVNDKRGNLTQSLLRAFRQRAALSRLVGIKPLKKTVHIVAHYRYGTSSGPSKIETHWHRWMRPRTSMVWHVEGMQLVRRKQRLANLITHNGDFEAWSTPRGRMEHVRLGQWLTDTLGEHNPAEGDSAKIAGMMDLLITQGQWEASIRLAYALLTGDRLPHHSAKGLRRVFEQVFSTWSDSGNEPAPDSSSRLTLLGCTSLADVFERNPDAVQALVKALWQACLEVTRDWPEASKRLRRRFVGQAVQAFFCNDLNEAARIFMQRAEGTFGLVITTSLHPGAVCLVSDRQPLFVGTDPEQGLLAYASEAMALRAATSPVHTEQRALLPYRFDLCDGDIVLIQVHEDTADNTIKITNRYSSNPPVSARITTGYLEASAGERDFRGWVALRDNPFTEARFRQGSDRVLMEMREIPAVLARMQQDWDQPTSYNRRTARAFSAEFLASAQAWSDLQSRDKPAHLNIELDLLLIGVENSHYLASSFAEDLRLAFPYLRAESVDAVSYCENPQRFAVGSKTITLAISHSGQTFNTVDAVKFIQALHQSGKAGPVFVMTGEVDTLLGAAVGQSVKSNAIWRERVFDTGAGWRTAEPATVSSVAIHATLTQLLLRLIVDACKSASVRPRPFGLVANENDAQMLDRMARFSVTGATAVLGQTAEGWDVETEEHRALTQEGAYLAKLLTEPAVAFVAAAMHLFIMLWLGWNPVVGAQSAIHSTTDWPLFDEDSVPGSLICVMLETGYFLFAGVAFMLMLRWFQGRPLWDRVFVGRTLIIGDVPCVKNLLAQYVSKLFSQAYEFAGFAAVHAADTRSGDLLHVYSHRITRGLLLFIGLPDGRWPGRARAEAAACMTCSQVRSVKNMGAGATVIGIGHNPASAVRVDRYLLLHKMERNPVSSPQAFSEKWSELACSLQESRFAALERLLASYVVFHTAAARTRDFVNRLVPVANCLWMPAFWTVRLITAGRVRPRFGYWDLSRTQSGTLIATTAAPVPAISLAPQDYLTPVERCNGSSRNSVGPDPLAVCVGATARPGET